MIDSASSFENASVAAVLTQRSRLDQRALLDYLVALLAGIVPGVQVERALLRRHVTAIRLPLRDTIYVLKRTSSETYDASRQHQVRGVVIRTVPMEIDAFLAELGVALDAELQHTEDGRKALRQWLYSNS